MKKISFLILTLFLLASCSQDSVETATQPTGKEVTAHFSINMKPMVDNATKATINTKSTDPTGVDESQISNMWVVQFDKATGAFIKKSYSEFVNVAAYDAPLAPSLSGASNIYFVANIGQTLATVYTETEFLKQIKAINSEAGFLINGKPISGNTKLNIPMFGSLLNITVPSTGFMETLSVTMTRALARVDVTYTVPDGLAANFTLENVRLCNVPIGIQFAPAGTAGNAATSTVAVQNFDQIALSAITGTNTLTFYLPENQKGVGVNTALTNERLKIGVTDATYIEFTGHTKGAQGGEEMGLCIYPGKDIYNDYNLTRNTKYAITTTLADISPSDQRVKVHEANCYVLHPGGTINVSVMPANKSDLGVQIPDVTTGWSAAVYWQSASGLVTVSSATANKGYFKVTAPSTSVEGNALVTAVDGSGNILWSWHIWVVNEDFNRSDYQEVLNGYTWMDRNLGAITRSTTYNVTPKIGYDVSAGLYYQWGRKDPFIGTVNVNTTNPVLNTTFNGTTGAFAPPATYLITGLGTVTTTLAPNSVYIRYADASAAPISYTNQLAFSVRYPLLFLSNWTGSAAKTATNGSNSWGGEFNQPKSAYDPCPEGWRVPSAKKVSTTLATPWGAVGAGAWPDNSYNNGNCYYFNMTGTNGMVSYPCTGYIGNSYAFGACGASAYYWTGTLLTPTNGAASSLYFTYATVTQAQSMTRYYGLTLRCVKI